LLRAGGRFFGEGRIRAGKGVVFFGRLAVFTLVAELRSKQDHVRKTDAAGWGRRIRWLSIDALINYCGTRETEFMRMEQGNLIDSPFSPPAEENGLARTLCAAGNVGSGPASSGAIFVREDLTQAHRLRRWMVGRPGRGRGSIPFMQQVRKRGAGRHFTMCYTRRGY